MAGNTKDKQTAAQKATRFDGEKSNRNTKGNSSTRINKSKISKLLDQLMERKELAFEIIDDILANKGDRTADQKSTAQWLVNSIVSVSKACTAEELGSFNARLKGKRDDEPEEQTPAEIEKEFKPRLVLTFKDPNAVPNEDEE
jgi:hypothetical protein